MTPEERTESRRANAAKARATLAAKRASGEVKPYTKREKVAPEPAVWSFNVDDKGELAIVDTNDGSGVELKPIDAQRLRAFLSRALPPEGEAAIERIRTREALDA